MHIKRMVISSFVILLSLFISIFMDIEKYWVVNNSMSPKISDGAKICVLRINDHNLITRHFPVFRNQIYLFNQEVDGESKVFIKRCVAKFRDSVFSNRFKRNEFYVNSVKAKSELSNLKFNKNFVKTTIRKSELFLIGDNYNKSIDSRDFGVVEKNQLVGIYLWNCKK